MKTILTENLEDNTQYLAYHRPRNVWILVLCVKGEQTILRSFFRTDVIANDEEYKIFELPRCKE